MDFERFLLVRRLLLRGRFLKGRLALPTECLLLLKRYTNLRTQRASSDAALQRAGEAVIAVLHYWYIVRDHPCDTINSKSSVCAALQPLCRSWPISKVGADDAPFLCASSALRRVVHLVAALLPTRLGRRRLGARSRWAGAFGAPCRASTTCTTSSSPSFGSSVASRSRCTTLRTCTTTMRSTTWRRRRRAGRRASSAQRAPSLSRRRAHRAPPNPTQP